MERYVLKHLKKYGSSHVSLNYVGKTNVFVNNPARFKTPEDALQWLNLKWIEILKWRFKAEYVSVNFGWKPKNIGEIGVAIVKVKIPNNGYLEEIETVSEHFPTDDAVATRFLKILKTVGVENDFPMHAHYSDVINVFRQLAKRDDFDDFRFIFHIAKTSDPYGTISGSEVFSSCFHPSNVVYGANWMVSKNDQDLVMARLRFDVNRLYNLHETA